jgi:hypothetical protein
VAEDSSLLAAVESPEKRELEGVARPDVRILEAPAPILGPPCISRVPSQPGFFPPHPLFWSEAVRWQGRALYVVGERAGRIRVDRSLAA